MKKLTTISSIFALMAVPAIAAPTHTSATFPQSGVMEEDYQYTGQANVTNLKVASGTANTLAGYTDCPSGYPNSDAGATSTDECYKACTVADLPANSHAATATGKNYSDSHITDTCAIASCDTGYTLNPGNPNLTEIIGVTYGYINHSGTYNGIGSTSQATYGITEPDTWAVGTYSTGFVTGKAVCSTQAGTTAYESRANITADFTNGYNCWCQIDSYNPSTGQGQSVSTSWRMIDSFPPDGYGHGGPTFCAEQCAYSCVSTDGGHSKMVNFAIMGSCDANVITINWDHADAADITANDAGSVTYGGNINTPKKAQHINGKIFTGWTFVTPNQ